MFTVSDSIKKCAEHALPKGERARARAQIGPAAVYIYTKKYKNSFQKSIDKYNSILYNIGVMRKEFN